MRRDLPTSNETLNQLKEGSAKLWMLLVGVNRYQKPLDSLNFAVADCQGFKKALEKATEQFEKVEFFVHSDDDIDFPTTLEAVHESLQKIASQANPLDVILFYFAGHGKIENVSQQPFLCLADTQVENLSNTGLALDEVIQQFQKCPDCKQLVLLDACHSGGITNLLGRARGEEAEEIEAEEVEKSQPDPVRGLAEVLQQQASQSKNFCAILSCDENQKSWEYPELQHGVFTYYLIKAFQGAAADKKGVIKANKISEYTQDQVRLFTTNEIGGREQNPVLFTRKSEPIVLGWLPPYNSHHSFEDSLRNYTITVEKEIYKSTFPKKKIEEIKEIKDVLDDTSCQKLKELGEELGLFPEEIQSENNKVFQRHLKRLKKYQEINIDSLKKHYSLAQDYLSRNALLNLEKSQQSLRINSELAAKIRNYLLTEYRKKINQYREEFRSALYKKALSYNEAHQKLEELQQKLDLGQKIVEQIEKEENTNYQRSQELCQQRLEEAIRQLNHLKSGIFDELLNQQKQDLENELDLNSQTIQVISESVVTKYEQNLKQYREQYTTIKQGNQPIQETTADRMILDTFRQDITNKSADIIEAEVDYEELFTQAIQPQSQGLSSDNNHDLLEEFWNSRDLPQEIIDSIEAKVREKYRHKVTIVPVEEDDETPETSPLPEQKTSPIEDKSSVNKKPKQAKVNFLIIAILVVLGVLTQATVFGVPHIELLCQVVGNCENYKRELEKAQVNLNEARNLKPQNQKDWQIQRDQIQEVIKQLNDIPENAPIYPQVLNLQQLAEKEVGESYAKEGVLLVKEAQEEHLNALRAIEEAEDPRQSSVETKCQRFREAHSYWDQGINKVQKAIKKLQTVNQPEGLIQYAQALEQQVLKNYQQLQEETSKRISNLPACDSLKRPIWRQ